MIGERLKRARSAASLSMRALAAEVGVSQAAIKKYEHDQIMPSSKVLLSLSKALSVRTEYFFRPSKVTLEGVEFRKRSNTPKGVLSRLTADVLDQSERWIELRNLWPNLPVSEFLEVESIGKIEKLDDVEQAAVEVRREWKLGLDPISDLIGLLESKGILVIITESAHADKFDGLQATVEGIPVVVVSSSWPGCRQRFTLAHELGHMMLHDKLDENVDEEKACNRFAGSFLLPKDSVISQIGESRKKVDWKELYFLKHEYGLSMQAALYRCKDLGIINESQHRSMSIDFSAKGWRSKEPGEPYPTETTQYFEQLVYRGAGEMILSDSKAAELLKMSVVEFRKSRQMQCLDAD